MGNGGPNLSSRAAAPAERRLTHACGVEYWKQVANLPPIYLQISGGNVPKSSELRESLLGVVVTIMKFENFSGGFL
jgi:hypothetical protein